MRVDLLQARSDFVAMARPSIAYVRQHRLDWSIMEATCGGVFLAPIRPDRHWFDFDPDGVEAVVIEARGADSVEVVDLVAWLPANPGRWWTVLGAATVLGEAFAASPTSGFGGAPLRLHRTPLAWLQAGCDGAVILDPNRGGRWLMDLDHAAIAAEDADHAAEIDAMRLATAQRQPIVIPQARRPRPRVAA